MNCFFILFFFSASTVSPPLISHSLKPRMEEAVPVTSRVLHIRNLPSDATEADVFMLMSTYGPVSVIIYLVYLYTHPLSLSSSSSVCLPSPPPLSLSLSLSS